MASPPEPPDGVSARIPYLPWLVAAVAWTWAAVALGWVVIGALVSVTWLTAVHTPAAQVVATIGQGWLAAHGVPVDLGGIHLAMPPLGLTALLVAACALAAHHAAGQYELDPDAPASRRWLAWAGVTGAGTGSYLLAGGILAAIVGTPDQLAPAL
ncbi:MAG: DUF6350 family protein, partial [Propionibacteriaceae bacterium]|nr:DUF6350 family protein [Propionibacteriaceae bacterium]